MSAENFFAVEVLLFWLWFGCCFCFCMVFLGLFVGVLWCASMLVCVKFAYVERLRAVKTVRKKKVIHP